MMVKPSVSELLTKSKNRYELVIATSKRKTNCCRSKGAYRC